METHGDIRTVVRDKYASIAEGGGCGCGTAGSSCCTSELDYSAAEKAAIPQGANLGLGCGAPVGLASPKPGDTVLDLGSGAGVDVFLAAREVGSEGHVIGVDMTPAMIDKARANAAKGGYTNVEFRLGEIEHLPVHDASVDVIVSNCVVNLSPDKGQVFREAYRVLKPGGRMLLSDLVLEQPLPPEIKESTEAYVGCIAGASLRGEYLAMIRDAGFQNVEVVAEGRYGTDPVTSIQVRALKKLTP